MARLADIMRSATSSANESYCPDAGEIVSINFDPQSGREMAGRHFALVLSQKRYNELARLCVLCPITGQIKGYPFEVALPAELKLGLKEGGGCVLSDQIKSMSWQERGCRFVCNAPPEIMAEVLAKCRALLSL